MSVTYNPINWQDGESGGTSLDATNLNIMEQGIIDSANAINSLEEEHTQLVGKHIQVEAKVNALNNYVYGAQGEEIGLLQEKVGNAETDIENLSNTVSDMDKSFRTELELKADRIVQAVSGHFLTMNDTPGYKPSSISLYGKATQGGTSGKQLFDKNKVTSNKYVGANGVLATGSATYSVSEKIYLGVGSYVWSGNTGKGINIGVYNNDSWVRNIGINTANIDVPITIADGENNIIITMLTADVEALQLEKGTVATTYEPYTGGIASPNPDYPQEVTVAGADGDIELTSCEKNLYDVNDKLSVTASEFNVDANGYITLDSYVNSAQNVVYRLYYTNPSKALLPNTKYKIVVEIPVMSGCTLSLVTNVPTDKNNSQFNANKRFDYAGTYEYEATTLSDFSGSGTMLRTVVNVPVGSTASCKFRIMVMPIKITDNTYKRYYATTAIIPLANGLAGIPVASGGNYVDEKGQQWLCDTIEFVKGRDTMSNEGKYVQRIKKLVITGNETFKKGSSAIFITIENDMAISQAIGLCSHSAVQNTSSSDVAGVWMPINGDPYLRFWNFADTAEELANFAKQEYANGNPITIYYPLAEPIATSLTSEQLSAFGNIHTFYPVTNLFTDDIGDVGMEYVADTKSYIDNKFKELATAILSAVGSEG